MGRRFRPPAAAVVVIVLFSWAISAVSRAADGLPIPAGEPGIVSVLESSPHGGPRGHPMIAEAVTAFYEHRGHGHAWIAADKQLTPGAHALIRRVAGAQRDGLPPLRSLPARVKALVDDRHLDGLDVLLTEVFLAYGLLLAWGQVPPAVIHRDWRASLPPRPDLLGTLMAAAAAGDIDGALDRLEPPTPGYRLLREALGRYLDAEVAGGWEVVPDGPLLRLGDTGARVRILRARLRAEGDLTTAPAADLYDDALMAAVRRFQARHGLQEDGIVGPATLAALNVPIATRVRQIVLNLERHRWLPPLATRRASVNVLGKEVILIDEDREVMRTRVLLVHPSSRAPVVATRMTAVVLNPQRQPPPGVEFRLLDEFGACPSDTPESEARVALDGGCLQVGDPLALVAFALADDAHGQRAEIESAATSADRRRIDLRRPLPVYLLYWTAWADPDGGVSFREDRYGFDERLTLALMGLR